MPPFDVWWARSSGIFFFLFTYDIKTLVFSKLYLSVIYPAMSDCNLRLRLRLDIL